MIKSKFLITISRLNQVLSYPNTLHAVFIMQAVFQVIINFIDAVSCNGACRYQCPKQPGQPIYPSKRKKADQATSKAPGYIDALQTEKFEGSLQTTIYVVATIFHD